MKKLLNKRIQFTCLAICCISIFLYDSALSQNQLIYGAALTPEKSIVYREIDGQSLTMDYYKPLGEGPHPVAIIIHGGGWIALDSRAPSEAYCADFLVPAGYIVFSINYRLATKYHLVDMISDVKSSIRFIRYHAKEFDANPDKIALIGGSAGGYLSNMVGLSSDDVKIDSKNSVDKLSSRTQAVVTLYGPSDMNLLIKQLPNDMKEQADLYFNDLLLPLSNQIGIENAIKNLSPINNVTSQAPPFLLIHGENDEHVTFEHSVLLMDSLKQKGVKCDLIRIPNGIHATLGWHRIPDAPEWEKELILWLNKVLEHNGPVGEGIRRRVIYQNN